MSVIIPKGLPAEAALGAAGLAVNHHNEEKADITIGIVNLMPIKTDTELDFLRIIAPSAERVDVRLIRMMTHRSSHTSEEHLDRFYTSFDSVAEILDGVIITGAPLENIAFEDVDYWPELTSIFHYLRRNRIPTLNICWAAYAALYHRFGLSMKLLSEKISGIYPNRILQPDADIAAGLSDNFPAPFSRFATWDFDELDNIRDIEIIASGKRQGPHILQTDHGLEIYITGHGEYATDTLHKEYVRDLSKFMNPKIPANYYPDDNPDNTPADIWHSDAVRIMGNWLGIVRQHQTTTKQHPPK